jgi:hypothetical protein
VIKEIFEGGTEEVNDKNIVEAFLAKIIDIRNSSCFDISPAAFVRGFGILTAANKDFVCSIFISQLGCIAFSRLLEGGKV